MAALAHQRCEACRCIVPGYDLVGATVKAGQVAEFFHRDDVTPFDSLVCTGCVASYGRLHPEAVSGLLLSLVSGASL